MNYSIEKHKDSTEWKLPNNMGIIHGNKFGDFTVSHPSYPEEDYDTFEEAEGRMIELLKQELRSATEQLTHFAKKTKEICDVLVS